MPNIDAGTAKLAGLQIDRSKPFNPSEFIGAGWRVWRGPIDGNGLEGEEEQDVRSLGVVEIDLNKIFIDTTLSIGETSITGEERIRRLVAKNFVKVKMDTKIFQTLWENKKMIPERFKEKTNGETTFVFVDGTILRSPSGRRYSLYFYWYVGNREWFWNHRWLDNKRYANCPSALLAS